MISLKLLKIAPYIGIVVGAATLYFVAYNRGQESIQVQWDKAKLETLNHHLDAMREAQAKQVELTEKINTIKRATNEETSNLRATVNTLASQLRDRPTRENFGTDTNAGTRTDTSTAGCTGAQLFRDDAEFLAREAERADTLRLLLKECRSAYTN